MVSFSSLILLNLLSVLCSIYVTAASANEEEARHQEQDLQRVFHPSLLVSLNTSSLLSLSSPVDVSLPFPAYYINVETNTKFRRRMENTFGTVWDLRRVPSKYTRGITSLHLKTIRHAYLQGDPFVFVTEDKISPFLMPFWSSSIRDLLLNLHEKETDWHVLQLGWMAMKTQKFYNSTQWGPAQRILSHPVHPGAIAYVLSRAGMKEFVKRYFLEVKREHQKISTKIRFLPEDEEGNVPKIDQYLRKIDKNFLVMPSLFTVDAFEKSAASLVLDGMEPERLSNDAHIDATLSLLYHLAGETEDMT